MCKQHTCEKGLCSEFEFDLFFLTRPSYLALKAHCNVLHFALLTLCCLFPGSGDDHIKPLVLFVLYLAVLCLVLLLEEVWKIIQRNP